MAHDLAACLSLDLRKKRKLLLFSFMTSRNELLQARFVEFDITCRLWGLSH